MERNKDTRDFTWFSQNQGTSTRLKSCFTINKWVQEIQRSHKHQKVLTLEQAQTPKGINTRTSGSVALKMHKCLP